MTLTFRTLAPLLVLGVAGGCAGSTAPVSGVVSASVIAVSPSPNALDVSSGDTIALSLNMPMDTASCRSRFTLQLGDSAGVIVPGRMSFGDGYRQMMFVPDSMMRSGTRYFAQLRDSVMVGDGTGGMMSTGGMMGGQHQLMMFGSLPAGAMRMGGGMGWYFTTAS